MHKFRLLGQLQRPVMEHLWGATEPQTVRQVHTALSVHRALAYTTVMAVLRRLADKGLVVQFRDGRAHRYAAVQGFEELVAALMLDALDQVPDFGDRRAALVHFVDRVGPDELCVLRRALSELEVNHAAAEPPLRRSEEDEPTASICGFAPMA